jgi:hypothetical protein
VAKTAVVCGFVAFIASAFIIVAFSLLGTQKLTDDAMTLEIVMVAIATAAGAIAGVMIGRQKAFKLKLGHPCGEIHDNWNAGRTEGAMVLTLPFSA